MISSSTLTIQNLTFGKRVNWLLLAAVAATLISGLVISFVVFPAVSAPVGLENYGDGWAQVAENIVRGNGFVYDPKVAPTFMTGHLKREPVYPLFLASILAVFGKLDPYMVLFQTLINSLTCFVLYFIVSKTFTRQAALLACFFYAFYPFASWYVPRIAYETVLGLLVALLVLSLVNLFEGLSFRRALVVGLLLGTTVLCRGTYLLFPLVLLPALMIRFGPRLGNVIKCWLTIVVAMVAVLSPWTLRNYVASRDFVPVTTLGGISYFIGNKIVDYYSVSANTAGVAPDREAAQMYSDIGKIVTNRIPNLSDPQLEAQVDKELVRMAVNQIISHPMSFLQKMLKGMVLVWFLGDTGLKSTALLLMQGPVVFLAVIGIFYALRTKMPILPLLTILFYFVGIQTAFTPLGRYSYPMVPVLIAFGAYSLDMIRRKYFHATAS